MANRRNLKKSIRYACGDIAGECIFAETNAENVDKWDNIIINVALLQEEAIKRLSVPFDKTPKDFENKKEYRKARRAHFKQVEKALTEYMHTETKKVIEEMNALASQTEK